VTYTTQTFQRGGFSVRRFVAGLFVATLVVGVAAGAVMLSPLSNNARGLTFHSSVVDRGSPLTLAPGATASVTLRFRNAGLAPWERGVIGTQVELGVKGDSVEFAKAGMAVGWLSDNRIATTTEPIVPPGADGTFTFSVRAPTTLGLYRIPVRLVVNDVTWLDDQDTFVVVASDFGFHSELVDQSRHPTLRVGETSGPITVRLRNTGTRAWVRGSTDRQVNLGLDGDQSLKALAVGWPSADRVAIQTEAAVAPGDAATFAFRVRAPSTPGTYALRLRPVVDGVTWLGGDGVLSLITVTTASGGSQPQTGSASFTSTATVAQETFTAGASATITVSFRSASATSALLGLEIYAPGGGSLAYQKWFDEQTFAAGEQRVFAVTWQVPATAVLGKYSVSLRAFAPGWKTLYGSKDGAATLSIAAPVQAAQPTTAPGGGATAAPTTAGSTAAPKPLATSFTSSATTTPGSVLPGSTVNVATSFTSATATKALVTIAIYAPNSVIAAYQQSFDDQSFGAGQQRSYPITWLVPTNATTGSYRVSLGVFSPGYGTQYSWTETAATFTIAATAPAPTVAPTVGPTAAPTATTAPTATPAPATGTPPAAPLLFPGDPTGYFDAPTPNASVTGTLLVWGWAVDRNASGTTSGVDQVVLYRDGPPGAGVPLGTATYGLTRPDVGGYFGNARWNNSGWQFNWAVGALSAGPHTLYIEMRSTVTGTTKLATQSVTVAGVATPTPVPTAPPPAPPGGRLPASVIAPSGYTVPAGALMVSNSAELASALAGGTARDIVLASGSYDNGGPFMNGNGHRLYSATLGGAVLRSGLVIGGNGGATGGMVRGITFDVNNSSKTLQDSIIHIWGSAGRGTRILDTTFAGNNVVGHAVLSRQPEGLVMQRVRVRDFRINGLTLDANVQNLIVATPMLIEDIDVANVSAAVPRSFDGRAEACIWLGNTGTLRRAIMRNCAWMGLWTGTSATSSVYEDLDIDGTPTGAYVEHFTYSSTFQRMRIGPGIKTGVVCEWADPGWGYKPACVDNVFQDSTFYSWSVGIYMDEGTTRTAVRRVTFIGQQSAAIVDYKGIGNTYIGNDYTQIAPGAVPVR
jgi:hypothetical protein